MFERLGFDHETSARLDRCLLQAQDWAMGMGVYAKSDVTTTHIASALAQAASAGVQDEQRLVHEALRDMLGFRRLR